MTDLALFLKDKPLYYKAFDPLRMKQAYESISNQLVVPKIIHVIGTNGKGSTGRYLAQMLMQMGLSIGHYTSPHIQNFNERIWLNGNDLDNSALDAAFTKLCLILEIKWQEQLSYFEFTTLLALMAFESCDYVILEAGLGGEHDATAVFDNILTIITPIGLDHEDFLGSTIDAVASTKLRAIRHKAVIAKQWDPKVYTIADQLATEKRLDLILVENTPLKESDLGLLEAFSHTSKVGYLIENFKTALIAFRTFYPNELELNTIETLFGRLTKLRPNITVDVGHNLLAAEKILHHFGESKVNLVYNTLKDKEYEKILMLLKPIISTVEIIEIEDERALEPQILINILNKLALTYRPFEEIKKENIYLVFGSFKVVEAFLKRLNG